MEQTWEKRKKISFSNVDACVILAIKIIFSSFLDILRCGITAYSEIERLLGITRDTVEIYF